MISYSISLGVIAITVVQVSLLPDAPMRKPYILVLSLFVSATSLLSYSQSFDSKGWAEYIEVEMNRPGNEKFRLAALPVYGDSNSNLVLRVSNDLGILKSYIPSKTNKFLQAAILAEAVTKLPDEAIGPYIEKMDFQQLATTFTFMRFDTGDRAALAVEGLLSKFRRDRLSWKDQDSLILGGSLESAMHALLLQHQSKKVLSVFRHYQQNGALSRAESFFFIKTVYVYHAVPKFALKSEFRIALLSEICAPHFDNPKFLQALILAVPEPNDRPLLVKELQRRLVEVQTVLGSFLNTAAPDE